MCGSVGGSGWARHGGYDCPIIIITRKIAFPAENAVGMLTAEIGFENTAENAKRNC